MKDGFKKRLKDAVLVLSTFVIIFYLFKNVQWPEMGLALRNIRIPYFISAVFVSLVSSAWIGSVRFRMIIRALGGQVSFSDAFLIKMGSQPLNLLPCGKANLWSQIFYLKKQKDFSFLSGAHLVFFSLFLNFLVLLGLAIVASIFGGVGKETVIGGQIRMILFCFFVVGCLPFLLFGAIRSEVIRHRFLSWIGRIFPRLKGEMDGLIELYERIRGREIFIVLLYSMVFQYAQIVLFVLLVKCLGLSIPILSILVCVPLVIILSNIPITVAGFGLRESMVLYFFSMYGVQEALLVLGMLFSFCQYIVPSLLGLFFVRSFLEGLLVSAKRTDLLTSREVAE
jgi:uncharacterized protein (TIRG00374 family)